MAHAMKRLLLHRMHKLLVLAMITLYFATKRHMDNLLRCVQIPCNLSSTINTLFILSNTCEIHWKIDHMEQQHLSNVHNFIIAQSFLKPNIQNNTGFHIISSDSKCSSCYKSSYPLKLILKALVIPVTRSLLFP